MRASVVRRSIFAIDGDGLVGIFQGGGKIAGLEERPSATIAGEGMLGIARYGLVEILNGQAVGVLLQQCSTAVVLSIGSAGVETDRFRVVRDGPVDLAIAEIGDAAPIVQRCATGNVRDEA